MQTFFLFLILVVVIIDVFERLYPYINTSNTERRPSGEITASRLAIATDYQTGIQYITVYGGGVTPRLGPDGLVMRIDPYQHVNDVPIPLEAVLSTKKEYEELDATLKETLEGLKAQSAPPKKPVGPSKAGSRRTPPETTPRRRRPLKD